RRGPGHPEVARDVDLGHRGARRVGAVEDPFAQCGDERVGDRHRLQDRAGRHHVRHDYMSGMTSLPGPVLDALRAAVGAEHVRTAAGDLAAYARDATPLFHRRPDAVVFPGSAAEVAAVLRIATEHRVPVVPRGAGSNLAAATVPTRGGIVLVLTRMNRILEISPDELLARVEPGVTNAALADAAAARG